GLNLSRAYQMPSARIRRPSASVFATSTLVPSPAVTTSPGNNAEPEIKLCDNGTTATTFTGAFWPANAITAPNTAPPPALSVCMRRIELDDVLRLYPPVSNVLPLPTIATG